MIKKFKKLIDEYIDKFFSSTILKEITEASDAFVPPIKEYYVGKIKFGTPYFDPRNFNPNIIFIRKLIPLSEEVLKDYASRGFGWKDKKWSNLPMVRRNKNWTVKIFNNHYHIQIGYPFAIHKGGLGWKWKYDSVRFEWIPSFQIYFFKWQFVILWNAPDKGDHIYYEMMLHYLKNSNKDINVARATWGWTNMQTNKSTWDENYLIK